MLVYPKADSGSMPQNKIVLVALLFTEKWWCLVHVFFVLLIVLVLLVLVLVLVLVHDDIYGF